MFRWHKIQWLGKGDVLFGNEGWQALFVTGCQVQILAVPDLQEVVQGCWLTIAFTSLES